MVNSGRALAADGHTVDYLFREDLPLASPVPSGLLVPWLIPVKVLGARRRGRALDVVEIHEPLGAPYALLARLRFLRLPPSVVLSYGLESRGWRIRRIVARRTGRRLPLKSRLLVPLTLVAQARYAVRHAAHVVVPSAADARHLLGAERLDARRITIAPTGVAPSFFAIGRPRRLSGGPRVVFVGSWIERKGIAELVLAWEQVVERTPHGTLTLIGAAPAAEVTSSFSPTAQSRLEVIPFASDLVEPLAAHDIGPSPMPSSG